jgi:hypothetical protein
VTQAGIRTAGASGSDVLLVVKVAASEGPGETIFWSSALRKNKPIDRVSTHSEQAGLGVVVGFLLTAT